MKKRNLILSLICSIALTIGLVTFTIISIVQANKNNADDVNKPVSDVTDTTDINEGRDGSVENPYLIDSAEKFNELVIGKYLDEEGNYIDYTAVAEDGNLVNPELNAGLNYELVNDIDFAGANITTMFNKGVAFNGAIDGKGFALNNVTIEVTKENLAEFMYLAEGRGMRAHIALFGMLDGAKISNLTINNMSLSISTEVLEYLRATDTTFVTDYKDVMFEVTVGMLAGIAFDSEIAVNVNGTMDAFAYCYREDEKAAGCNAVGGLIGSVVGGDISNSQVDVDMTLVGKNYFVGGLVGKAYNLKSNNVKADLTLSTQYNQNIYVGGAYGYAQGLELDGAKIKLAVVENGEGLPADILDLLSSEKVDELINTAGIVAYIRANDEAQKATIKNVEVYSDVAIEGVHAGVYLEVWSTADKTVKTVFIENIAAVSNVETLKAYGFARNMLNTEVKSKLACEQAGYDFAIAGEVKFTDEAFKVIADYIDEIPTTLGEDGYEELTIILGKSLKAELGMTDLFMVNNLEKAGRLEVIDGRIEIKEEVEEAPESGENVESGENTETESGENVESGENTETESGENVESGENTETESGEVAA